LKRDPAAVARVGVEDEARGAATTGEDEPPPPRNSQSIGIRKLLLSRSSHPLAMAMSRFRKVARQGALSRCVPEPSSLEEIMADPDNQSGIAILVEAKVEAKAAKQAIALI
jgi:hypothetical protein